MNWYAQKGEHDDIVVSSRVRLARNIRNIPFPSRMKAEDFEKIS